MPAQFKLDLTLEQSPVLLDIFEEKYAVLERGPGRTTLSEKC